MACAKPAPPTPKQPSLEALVLDVAAALEDGASARVADAMGGESVRVEVRQRLSETDERTSSSPPDRAALRAWVDANAREWRCDAGACRWRRGLVTAGPWSCTGDCCDVGPRPMDPETLYLQRVCFAAREGASRRLTYLGFTEVR